jgi:ribosome-associated translation inhibitor RaiA
MKRPKGNEIDLTLVYRGLKARPVWQDLVQSQFKRLQSLAAVVSAKVILEWQRGIKPAFRVLALLEVPGPDFHSEGRDHTLQAALLKAVKDLERQIRSRKSRRAERWKTKLQLGITPSRSPFALAGRRT